MKTKIISDVQTRNLNGNWLPKHKVKLKEKQTLSETALYHRHLCTHILLSNNLSTYFLLLFCYCCIFLLLERKCPESVFGCRLSCSSLWQVADDIYFSGAYDRTCGTVVTRAFVCVRACVFMYHTDEKVHELKVASNFQIWLLFLFS